MFEQQTAGSSLKNVILQVSCSWQGLQDGESWCLNISANQ